MTEGHRDHRHAESSRSGATSRRLSIVLGLVLAYTVVEIIGGLHAGSLALLADAGHMFSDAWAIGLALGASWLARRPATPQHTYGFHRVEALAALLNAGALMVVAVLIMWEAWQRLSEAQPVDARTLLTVASGGLLVNAVSLWALHGTDAGNLNVRAAWWHVLGDALGSIQAVVAGALILAFGWYWADPAASAVIGLLVIYASWSLVREAVLVLMEGAPGHVDVNAVRERLMQVPGVAGVHDLHVWTIATGLVALSAHLAADRPAPEVLRELRRELRDEFGVAHTTIEFDPLEEGSDSQPL